VSLVAYGEYAVVRRFKFVERKCSVGESGGDDQTAGIAGTVAGTAAGTPVTSVPESTSTSTSEKSETAKEHRTVSVIGVENGYASYIAEVLTSDGYEVYADEDASYSYSENVIVYENPALADEAKALADYLGDGFYALENDGTFYMTTDFLIRIAG